MSRTKEQLPKEADVDLSIEHLNHLISTMSEWSMKVPFTAAQMAAWRLRWFGCTPEMDRSRAEDYRLNRIDRKRDFDEDYTKDHEPFTDWPNGQGVYY